MLTGGCFCGFVRYSAIAAAFDETLCHCTICRHVHGAPVVAWFSVPREAFSIVAGEPTRFASSAHAERSFCPRCGTPLTFRSEGAPQDIDIATCTLDDPEHVPPQDQTYVRSRVSWLPLTKDLPAFDTMRA